MQNTQLPKCRQFSQALALAGLWLGPG